jgi:glycine cleavage system H lipoate-binding protein
MATYTYNNGDTSVINVNTAVPNSSTLINNASLNNDCVFVITEAGTFTHKWIEKSSNGTEIAKSANYNVEVGDIIFVNYDNNRNSEKRSIIIVKSSALYQDYSSYLEYKKRIEDDVTDGLITN